MTTAPPDRQRIDKWLYFARVVKTRALAVKLVTSGHVRINGEKKRTPSATVKPGDALTIVMPRRVFVYRVIDCGERRGGRSSRARIRRMRIRKRRRIRRPLRG